MKNNLLYASLISLAFTASVSAAQKQPQFETVSQAPSVNLNLRNYPRHERLIEVYDYMMRKSGEFDANLFEANPSNKTLMGIYDLAKDTGRLGDIATAYSSAADDVLGIDRPVVETSVAKGENCGNKWLACSGTTVGMLGACAAAAASVGGLTFACAGLGLSFAGACGTALADCGSQGSANPSFAITSAGAKGDFPGTPTTFVCGTNSSVNRVRGLQVRSATGILSSTSTIRLVNQIKLTCSNGDVKTFDAGASGTNVLTENSNCGNGQLMQGFIFKMGQGLDGMKRTCDTAGTSGGAADVTSTNYLGGSGGTDKIANCPEGSYIYGLNTWDSSTVSTKKFFEGVEPLCRKQW